MLLQFSEKHVILCAMKNIYDECCTHNTLGNIEFSQKQLYDENFYGTDHATVYGKTLNDPFVMDEKK